MGNLQVTGEAPKIKWWQVILVTAAVSVLGSISAILSKKKQRKLYSKELEQAPWAPPAWVFGPAWTINNFFLIAGLRRLVNNNAVPEKKKLLAMQGIIWVIFFSFGYVYFKRKSPVLAAVWTMSDAALATASFILANRSDKKLALHYLPLLLWTAFASSVADYQAIKNPDPVLHSPAPAEALA